MARSSARATAGLGRPPISFTATASRIRPSASSHSARTVPSGTLPVSAYRVAAASM
jgi:hypothetical protein